MVRRRTWHGLGNRSVHRKIALATMGLLWLSWLLAPRDRATAVINTEVMGRTFLPIQDTYMYMYSSPPGPTLTPNDDASSELHINVGYTDREPRNRVGLIKFDVAALPEDEWVVYAGLSLFVENSTFEQYPRYVDARDVLTQWDERTVWRVGAPTLGESTEWSRLPFVHQQTRIEYDITRLAAKWHQGENNGLALEYDRSFVQDKFGSSYFGSRESQSPPMLRVVMTGDLRGQIATPTAALRRKLGVPYLGK